MPALVISITHLPGTFANRLRQAHAVTRCRLGALTCWKHFPLLCKAVFIDCSQWLGKRQSMRYRYTTTAPRTAPCHPPTWYGSCHQAAQIPSHWWALCWAKLCVRWPTVLTQPCGTPVWCRLQQPQITPLLGFDTLLFTHTTGWKSHELAEFQAQIKPFLWGLFYVNSPILCRFFSAIVAFCLHPRATVLHRIVQGRAHHGGKRVPSKVWLSGLLTASHFPLMLYRSRSPVPGHFCVMCMPGKWDLEVAERR